MNGLRFGLAAGVCWLTPYSLGLFGFSKAIGPFSYAGLPERERQAGGYSEAIAEAQEIIKEIEHRCAELLQANREALERLTAALLEHETVSGAIVDACLVPAALPEQRAA